MIHHCHQHGTGTHLSHRGGPVRKFMLRVTIRISGKVITGRYHVFDLVAEYCSWVSAGGVHLRQIQNHHRKNFSVIARLQGRAQNGHFHLAVALVCGGKQSCATGLCYHAGP